MTLILKKVDGGIIKYSEEAAKSVLRNLPLTQMGLDCMMAGIDFVMPEGSYTFI